MTHFPPTIEALDRAVLSADAAVAQATPEDREAAESQALAARLVLARRLLTDCLPNDMGGLRSTVAISEWLSRHGRTLGPVVVQSLVDLLRPTGAAGAGVRDAA